LVKNRLKTYPTLTWHVPLGELESRGSQMVYIIFMILLSLYARHNIRVWRTDRQTRRCRKDRAVHTVVRVKIVGKLDCSFLTGLVCCDC